MCIRDRINYDKSEFSAATPLHGGDEERLEEVYNKLHSLQDFLKPENYKTYDELKMKLNRVLGVDAGVTMEAPQPAPVVEEPVMATNNSPMADTPSDDSSSDEDTLSYFAKLANE